MAKLIIRKCCNHCKKTKDITEFHRHCHHKDGHRNICRVCAIAEVVKYQRTRKGRIVHRAAIRRYSLTRSGKNSNHKACKKFRIYNPEKLRAKEAVNYEVRKGRMSKAKTLRCVCCRRKAKQYHHYLGYESEHWLDVVPVCQRHHYQLDRTVKTA